MGLLDKWQTSRGPALAGMAVGESVPPPAPTGGLLSRWESKRNHDLRPIPPELPPQPAQPVVRPPGVSARPQSRPSPANASFWANLPAATSRPPHLLQQMQAEQAKSQGQLYREELAAEKARPWPTHISSQHSVGQNLAAPFLYGFKAIGEPFMAAARAARGIPGVDTALHGAGLLNKWLASKPRITDPQGNIQVTHDGLGDYVVPEAPAVDPNAGYYPQDMAALAPGLKDRFAEGGSAVFGERVRQQMQQVGAPRRQAQEQAQAALWSDPRNSQTVINQALQYLPLVGPTFDPQTQSVGEKLGEESGNPYMGMGLDALAGVSPFGLAGKVPALARNIAGRFAMPAGRAGAILGAEVNPVTRAAPLVTGLAERAATKLAEPGGMFDRWLARTGRAERGLDAQTQLPAIPEATAQPGAAQAPPVSRLGQGAGREAGVPTPDAPPVAARDGAPVTPPPARDIPGRPLPPTVEAPSVAVGPTLDEVKASLDAAKKEFNGLNSASIDGALSEADKARMIFLRTALPGLQKQLKQITKAAATMEGVQYSGTLPSRAANVYRLLQEITPEQLVQFSARADELAKSMGGRKARSAARRQVLEEMLLQADPEGVQYSRRTPPPSPGDKPVTTIREQPIERVRPSEEFSGLDEPDEFLYHVTSAPNARKILQNGFKSPDKGTFAGGAYEGYSRGKVFFTDRNGVDFWKEKVENYLFHGSDNPPPVEVLRVRKDAVQDILKPDSIGTEDAKAPAYFVDAKEIQKHQQSASSVSRRLKQEAEATARREALEAASARPIAPPPPSLPPSPKTETFWDLVPQERVKELKQNLIMAKHRLTDADKAMIEDARRRFDAGERGTPEGVQYSGGPQFNQTPPGPRVAPQPQPGPASPPPVTTTQAGSRVAPGVDLSGNVKSEPLIARDIRETMGMISRGETQEPGLLGRLRNAISQSNGPRLSYGEGGLPAGAGGAHHGKRQLIQIRRPVDGDTTYHELGHYIAKQGDIIDNAPAPAMGELASLGDPANPLVPKSKRGTRSSWAPGMSDEYKRGEGWAEYLRVWMSHPDEAERLAPEMTKHFESWLDSQGAVGQRMRQHQADVQARAAADFAKRMDAQVMMQKTRNQLEAQSSKDDLVTRFMDRFHPLRKLRDMAGAADEIKPSEDFYRKATMLASTVKNETTREVDRLADIFREIREAPNARQAEDELRRYLYARRAQELHDRGMRSGFEQSDISQALREYATPTNQKIADELYKFQDDQLEYLHEMGMLSDEGLAKIRAENKSYIPMQRHFELGAGELSNQRSGIAGASLKASNPIKAIRGSEREILDPLVGVIANTFKVRMSAAKNEVLRDLLRLWDKHGAKVGHGIEEIHPPQTFTPAAVGELLKEPKLRSALEDLGVDVSTVTPVELETLIEMLPEGTIARPNQAMLDAQHVIPIRDGGKTRYLKLSPEMHRSLTGIGSEFTTDPMSWLNNRAGNVLRAGATSLNWKFAIRNAIRDSLTLPLISRVGGATNLPFFPFADGLITNLRAAAGNPKAKEIVKRWRESGGRQDFEGRYADRTGAESVLYDGVLPSRSSAPARVGGAAWKATKKVLGSVSEASEDATRLGHYKAAEAYARRTHPHWSEEDIHLFAAFEARDALDFSRRGSAPAVRWARANIPFLGAGTEGTRRQIEAAIENPGRYFGMGLATMSAPVALNQTGIPGVVEGQWNNPDYWQLDQRKRDNDTILKNPLWDGVDSNQEFLKWPREKGPAGLFSQVPEWIATAARGDEASLGKRAKEIAGVVASDFLPAGVNPLEPKSLWSLLGEGTGLGAELMSNYDSFRDKPIVPEWLQRQHPDPSQQYDDRTSVLARFLGEKLGVAPMYIDHAIYGTTAGLGQSALNYVIDPALSAATQLTDKPIKQATSRQVTSPTQALLDMSGLGVYPGKPASLTAFDAQLLAAKQAKDRAVAHPRNKREAKQAARTLAPAERAKLKRMENLDRKISSLQRQIRLPDQTPEAKRALELELREAVKDYRPFKEVGP